MKLTFERYGHAELYAARMRRRGWKATQRGEDVFVELTDEEDHVLAVALARRYSLRAVDGVPV